MSIVIQDDGIISPFGIQSSRETKISVMPATRDSSEENEATDGDIDFGTVYGMGDFTLHGIIEFDDVSERPSIVDTVKSQLYEYISPQQLSYECKSDRYAIVRLAGKPDIKEYPHHIEIHAQFKVQPFWRSIEEHSLIGSGVITNQGTSETPLAIEIAGLVTNPSISIGEYTLAYTGTIETGQILIITVIENGAGTAKIGTANAMNNYNGIFPTLPPGSLNVVAGNNVTIKWNDRWL